MKLGLYRHLRKIAAAMLPAVCLAVSCTVAFAIEETVTRTTKSGKAVSLGGFMRTNKDCEGKQLPKAVLARPPQYGTVCFEIAKIKLLRHYVDPPQHPQCKGRPVRGIRILYVSAPGFSGKDTVGFKIQYQKMEVQRTAEIEVKGEGDFLLVERPPVSDSKAQQPGPVPRCVPLVS